jgi:S1-C subfamily serine protease
MNPSRHGLIWILFCWATVPLNLVGQDSSPNKLRLDPGTVIPAVVQLLAVGPGARGQNLDCSATGFIINEDGYILTNAHVVEKSRECLAQSPGAKIVAKFASPEEGVNLNLEKNDATRPKDPSAPAVSCDVVGVDEDRDLAVLKPEGPPPMGRGHSAIPYVLLGTMGVSTGAAVKVTGHPAFTWVALTQSGHILGLKSIQLSDHSDIPTNMIVLDIPLKRGSSGSPVYAEAAVVGVVERQNTWDSFQTLAVPIGCAIQLLDRLGVKWHAAPN